MRNVKLVVSLVLVIFAVSSIGSAKFVKADEAQKTEMKKTDAAKSGDAQASSGECEHCHKKNKKGTICEKCHEKMGKKDEKSHCGKCKESKNCNDCGKCESCNDEKKKS